MIETPSIMSVKQAFLFDPGEVLFLAAVGILRCSKSAEIRDGFVSSEAAPLLLFYLPLPDLLDLILFPWSTSITSVCFFSVPSTAQASNMVDFFFSPS